VINLKTAQVEIRGPMTKEEKVKWDRVRQLRKDLLAEIAVVEQELAEHPKSKSLQSELQSNQKLLSFMDAKLPFLNYDPNDPQK